MVGTKSLLPSWLLWRPQKPPRGASEWMERCSFKMPHLPGTHHPWVTDRVITAHQVSACLRKALSLHTREKSADKNHFDVIKAEEQWLPSTRLSFFSQGFSNYTQYFQRGFIKRRDWCLLKMYCRDIRKSLSLLTESYIGKECAWFILEITHD